jgi:hypothetical protein
VLVKSSCVSSSEEDGVVLPPRSNNPSVPPPVRIDPDVSAGRYKHLLKQIREREVSLDDLRAIQSWLSVDRYAPEGNKWKKEFPQGIKLVGFDKEP